MPGTIEGARKAAKTNMALHGKDFYKVIGRKGGKSGTTGGFFADRKLAAEAGRKGGSISKRGKPHAGRSINGVILSDYAYSRLMEVKEGKATYLSLSSYLRVKYNEVFGNEG